MLTPSSSHSTEHILFFTLLQLSVIVLAARAGGALARRLGQAGVVGEIVVGILLGPSLLGALAPELFASVFLATPALPLSLLSQIGLLLLMFQIGLAFDFAHLRERRHRRTVMAVAAGGLVAPFALGLLFAALLPAALAGPNRLGFALFVATAFSITAMPVLGRILIECGMSRSPLGVIAISAAAVTDVVGWLLLAGVTALSSAAFVPWDVALILAGVLAFAAISVWLLRPLLLRFVRAQMVSTQAGPSALSPTLMSAVLVLVFAAGMATYRIGIFAIFGGFMMGVLLHGESRFVQAWNDRVGSFVNVFFLPVFFTLTGLRTDIGLLSGSAAWGWCTLLIALATLGKFGGCWAAARAAGLSGLQARIVGILMNTRGLMELIIVNVGFELGILGHEVFTKLVLMAVFSTVITTPALRRWQARLPLAEQAPMAAVPGQS